MAGFVDLQINGYSGVDFNSEQITAEELHRCCQTLQRDGVAGVLATVITDEVGSICRKVSRIRNLCEQDPLAAQMIWGFHIEGPFLNPRPGFIGAHPAEHARRASRDEMARILDAGEGRIKLVTLAPEMDRDQAVVRFLAAEGVVVSAGHTDASLDELDAAIDAGLSMFTHLGNGCPMQAHRHDNIVQRALHFADRLTCSFIADGAHIPFFALKNYLRVVGIDRAVIVTDAISAAGCGPGRYQIGDQTVDVLEDGVPRAKDHSHLIGSGTIMKKMAENLRDSLQLTDMEIHQLTVSNPFKMLNAGSLEQVSQ